MQEFEVDYLSIKETSVSGRYVINEDVFSFMDDITGQFNIKTIGKSVDDKPIKMVVFGSGKSKILMWSQMHGNESTTTKAILDLINFLNQPSEIVGAIKKNCTLYMIPILNPDGAAAYTRINANEVDLNRDAQNLSQPESKVLRGIYDEIKPDFCFNLHGQRTIFNVGSSPKPATISFLTPSQDIERSITPSRILSMQVIAAMNEKLQKFIPGHIGRYDDSFNANCVGDTFQILNTPTVLFEAGHSPNDYDREITREYIWHALIFGIIAITTKQYESYTNKDYFKIPENNKLFFDILIENAHLINDKFEEGDRVGVLYKEILKNKKIQFEPRVDKVGELSQYYGHVTYDCSNKEGLKKLKNNPHLFELLK
ncbi:MAG: peptidase M14 [Flavobacteriaceae bacterium]|nr:MAG: peptidase M14 [Flavobacteriaceae bacterium]